MNKELRTYEGKVYEILKSNSLGIDDIARLAGMDRAMVRRIIDTLSLKYPVYEEKKGVYGILPG
jgi:DNA-binding IclR family transcriptional regulator